MIYIAMIGLLIIFAFLYLMYQSKSRPALSDYG